MREEMKYLGSTLGIAGGNQPHLRCNTCRTCTYVMAPRRVFTTFEALLAGEISTGAIYTRLHIHQPP